MAPEIPQDFTGTWITSKEQGEPGLRQSAEFNRTVPTHNGTASNLIWETINFDMITHVSALWLENAPLGGVATGCNTTCKATIRAPALFPASCTSTQLPVTPKSNFNITLVDEGIIALPLDTEYFFISSTLLLDHRESLEIVTGYSTIEYGCTGVLNYTKCDFMPGIGDYELVIKDDHIDMDSVGSPSFVAFANNTAANMTFSSTSGGHISTLAGIAGMLDDKWSTDFAYITDPSSGNVSEIVLGGVATQEFVASGHTKCHSFLDPRDAVVASINKLMLYTGAYAARQSKDFLDEHLDDGLSVHSTTLGRILGNHDVYHTNYWYFMAAALVEIVCISLVAPTYWGWWKLGRAVSFSPLELAQAFQSPLLADSDSHSARELAKDAKDIPIRYGYISTETKGKPSRMAFGHPAVVGSRSV